jgi:hypothetical protein
MVDRARQAVYHVPRVQAVFDAELSKLPLQNLSGKERPRI